MKFLFETKRLEISESTTNHIKYIMDLEGNSDNRQFIWQGSYDEHCFEIESKDVLLLIFNDKQNRKKIGYCLIHLNNKSEVFELRRIAISEKGKGYGREVMEGIIKYCFEALNMNRFWLDVYPDNEIGIKLYKSLGLVHEGTLRQSYKSERGYLNQMIFSMLNEEYQSKTKKY